MRTQTLDSGGGPHEVPAIMRKLGGSTKPNPPVLSRCKIALMSRYGHGTSTLLAGGADNIVLDFKGEGHSLKRQRALVIPVNDYATLENALAAALAGKEEDAKWPYKMVWFDRATNWQMILQSAIIDEWNEDRKAKAKARSEPPELARDIGETWGGTGGYSRIYDRAEIMIGKLWAAGYGIGYTLHLVDKEVKIGGEEQMIQQVNLYPGFRERLMSAADMRITMTHYADERDKYEDRTSMVGGKPVKNRVKVGTEQVDEFVLDFEAVGDPRRGGSRMALERLVLNKYPDNDPKKKTMWDRLSLHHEAWRKTVIGV